MRFIAGRAFAIGAIALTTLSLTGCNEEIDARQTKEIQGILYKIHAEDPFTGRVTNYPISVLGLFNVGTCFVDFKKGLPDGDMKCADNTGTVVGTGEFKAGKKDGNAERFDLKTNKKVIVEHWKNGRQDGVQEQYDSQTGEKILEVSATPKAARMVVSEFGIVPARKKLQTSSGRTACKAVSTTEAPSIAITPMLRNNAFSRITALTATGGTWPARTTTTTI